MTSPILTCGEARQALLEADLAELERTQPGPLAAHLAACASCRAAAQRVLAATRGLEAQRSRAPTRSAAATAARDALLESARLMQARRRRLRWTVAPLLAAAGLAAILLTRPDAPTGDPIVRRPERLPPLVESTAPRVAVFNTDNPAIVVVWQF
jgi:hypothetical protein